MGNGNIFFYRLLFRQYIKYFIQILTQLSFYLDFVSIAINKLDEHPYKYI